MVSLFAWFKIMNYVEDFLLQNRPYILEIYLTCLSCILKNILLDLTTHVFVTFAFINYTKT